MKWAATLGFKNATFNHVINIIKDLTFKLCFSKYRPKST